MLTAIVSGSWGAVRKGGSLYETSLGREQTTVGSWDGNTETLQAEPVPKNEFLRSLDEEETDPSAVQTPDDQEVLSLESTVSFWTDYSKVHLHPKTFVELRPALASCPPNFTGHRPYGDGLAFVESGNAVEEAEERLRFFMEEADGPQGFQLVVDIGGAFTALGSTILRHLAEEYPSLTRWVTAVAPPAPPQLTVPLKLTSVLSLASLASSADIFVPLGRKSLHDAHFPHVSITDSKPYHSSAVYATALDTITLPYRLSPDKPLQGSESPTGGCRMSDLVGKICRERDSRVSCCELGFPAPSISQKEGPNSPLSLIASLRNLSFEETLKSRLTFNSAESYVLRGTLLSGSDKRASNAQVQSALEREIFSESRGQCLRHICLSQQPVVLPLPFPRLFSSEVGKNGQVSNTSASSGSFQSAVRKGGCDVYSSPVFSRLSSGRPVVPYLEQSSRFLLSQVQKKSSLGADLLTRWGFDAEEQREMCETLQGLVLGSTGGHDSDTE